MHLSIRKLGNSAGIIFPSTMLRSLNLTVGSSVEAEQIEGKIVLTPANKPKYSLSELIAQCDVAAPMPNDIQSWESMEIVGKEVI